MARKKNLKGEIQLLFIPFCKVSMWDTDVNVQDFFFIFLFFLDKPSNHHEDNLILLTILSTERIAFYVI